MKNSALLLFGFLIALFSSCRKEANEKSKVEQKVIDFAKVVETDSLISPRELFSEAEFFLLKTPDSLKITMASKIREIGNKLFILDHKRRVVFAFSKAGNFLSLVGNQGEGPAEFSEVSDFDVHENQIYIYSRGDFSVYIFDSSNFEFIRTIKLEDWGTQISVLNSGNVALYSYMIEGDDNFNINIYNPDGVLIDKRMAYAEDGNYQAMNYTGFINGNYYTYPLSSIIYKIGEGPDDDSVKYEINFPGRFPESSSSNYMAFKESERNKNNENILTKFELGGEGEFICYYHFREGSSNGYTFGVRLANGETYGHLNMKHAAKGKFDDLYLQLFFKGPYNMASYSQESESFLIASNIESVGIYYDYIMETIKSGSVYDEDLLSLLKQTDLEETIIMKFKLKDGL
ncbi:6-bladed beta-propeller [Algoriphagus sp. D3-2-R+10]|uniref:6-bladed beta-propeller n=1 Tax=Algoriphagus aurantiacus TaxID=3103948 RepID=UPI002B3C539F|nr:6-bladed beta-propeller [Algoriphagus sp. D3-2-R+10]MEB2776848.1 6-bladed beta-propeller [Algoriphagus sp. D3-2-R+10]